MAKVEKVRETPSDDSGLFDEPPALVPTTAENAPWHPIPKIGPMPLDGPNEARVAWLSLRDRIFSSFPFDGSPVWLRGELNGAAMMVEAQWRTTRAWSRDTKRWESSAFWSIRNSGGMRVPFEPAGYMRAA